MIISCKATSLESAKYADKTVKLEQVTECPICKASINPMHLNTVFRIENQIAYFESQQFCTNCNHSFLCSHKVATNPSYQLLGEPKLDSVEPQKYRKIDFDPAIHELSAQFVKIYNQASAAEAYGLDEIAGLGYRKALEFLVKDYAIHEHPDDKNDIKKLLLSPCIKKYIDNPQIKTLVERSAWIGNDEAHYIRKQEDRDVNDMKAFIKATVYFISMVLITEDAASMEPK